MGATCPAALSTQKVTLGTLLKVREALWGDGGGGSGWFPSLTTEGEVVWAMSPIPTLPSFPQKAPRHQPCHSCTYGQVF